MLIDFDVYFREKMNGIIYFSFQYIYHSNVQIKILFCKYNI